MSVCHDEWVFVMTHLNDRVHSKIFFKWTHLEIFCYNALRILKHYFDGLLQDWSNSIANALELLQPCAKP